MRVKFSRVELPGLRGWRCNICGAIFVSKRDAERHAKTHAKTHRRL